MKDAFSTFHPVVNFIWFFAVLLFSMIFMHPVFLLISLFCSFCYSVILNGKRAVRFNLLYMLPWLLFMTMINPVFSHAGETILFYLHDGNPVTLESVLFGFSSSIMLVSVIMWFSCYNAIMTSDKFIYLFGKIIPSLSLIFSMVLRFVPRYKAQIKLISNAQRGIGRDMSNGNMIQRVKNGIRILSIMITWALENAIETADSMRSRGYGLPGRTSFSVFRFDSRDKTTLAVITVLILIVLTGTYFGQNTMRFFPSLLIPDIQPLSIFPYASWFLLCLIPVIIDASEEIKWKFIMSKT